jgi:hypothetical protein
MFQASLVSLGAVPTLDLNKPMAAEIGFSVVSR